VPTYQYACTACDHRFEAVQKFTDASLSECPECAGKLRKLYGSVGVVFKGSGFYRNDSRSKSTSSSPASSDSKSGTSESSGSESGSSKSADSAKPAKSAESKPAASSGTASSGTASSSTAKAS
jgi:putative FmdB family regulatory protein